jgi:hypothetical protein
VTYNTTWCSKVGRFLLVRLGAMSVSWDHEF